MGHGIFNQNKDAMRSRLPPYYDPKDGLTGRSNTATNASEGLADGLTWVRLDSVGEPTACVNIVINPVTPGIPVTTAINRKNGQREITGVDAAAYQQFSADLLRRAGVSVPLYFDSDSLLMGKVEPSSDRGGLWIFVREFIHDGGSFLSGERQYYELDSEVSGITASMQVMVIVGVDTSDNSIDVTVDSTERGLAYVYSVADADAITIPTDVIPLAALVLKAGQTLVSDCFGKLPPRYFDQRQFLNLAGGGSGGGGTIYTNAWASPPASPVNGDWWLPSDGTGVIFARVSGAWVNRGTLYPFTEPVDGDFAWINQGGATVTAEKGGIWLELLASNGFNRVRKQAAPSTPYTITAAFSPLFPITGSATNANFGLCFRQSSDGKLQTCGVWLNGAFGSVAAASSKWTDESTFSAHYGSLVSLVNLVIGSVIWLRIADDGTNRIFSISNDGQHWQAFHSVTRLDFMTGGADEVGFYISTNNVSGSIGVNLLSWVEG